MEWLAIPILLFVYLYWAAELSKGDEIIKHAYHWWFT